METGTDWLQLREHYDRLARSGDLQEELQSFYEDRNELRVLDLYCGNGASFRHLAPTLNTNQTWLLLENSTLLLNQAMEQTEAWALENGFYFTATSDRFFQIHIGSTTHNCALKLESLKDPHALPWESHDIVTASSLLDRASQEWLSEVFSCFKKHEPAFLFNLNYNGMMIWHPTHPLDARVTTAFNRYLRTGRDTGMTLGDRAPSIATKMAEDTGYEIFQSRSDWHLGEKDRDLILRQIDFIEQAAREMIEPESLEILNGWSSQKKYEARGGRCRLTVGHTDILGLPVQGVFGG